MSKPAVTIDDGIAKVTLDKCIEENSAPLGADSRANSRSNSFSESGGTTAALVIIGDEILNGFTADVNLQVTSRALSSIGIPLKMVLVVSDDIDEIAAAVQRMSQRYDIVFTSGGIGPTHDDVTLKAVAQALHQEIKLNSDMLVHLQEVQAECEASQADDGPQRSSKQRRELDEGMRRLAMLPEHAQLRFPPSPDDSFERNTSNSTAGTFSTDGSSNSAAIPSTSQKQVRTKQWPILQCDNIFVLPGIPQFFAAKMDLLVKHFLCKSKRRVSRKIVLDIEETTLLSVLDALVAQHGDVKFGSYPFVDHPEFKTIITLDGVERNKVEQAVAGLLEALPAHVVLRVEKGVAAVRL